jgi:phosphoribosyl-dephospho-CoA transferase
MRAISTAPRVHDLLQLAHSRLDKADQPQPHWVDDALQQCAWVVVRRDMMLGSQIPVGIRGSERSQRWACFVASKLVVSALAPHQLRSGTAIKNRLMLPALRALAILENEWSDLPMQWGPGGSVGYELATGVPMVSRASDLDIAIGALRPIERDTARTLLATTLALPGPVDVRVETSACGFSLREYAAGATKLLVRTSAGGRLVQDPWSLEDD